MCDAWGVRANADQPVFVFIDESGNLDFSTRGTRHFVMSALITQTPLECAHGLSKLTYEFLARGLSSQVPFHASENSNGTRHRVIGGLCSPSHNCFIITVSVDKHSLEEKYRSPASLYAHLGLELSKRATAIATAKRQKLVLLFDSALTARQRNAFLKRVKPELRQRGRDFAIAFRAVSHDVNGQRADLYAWAMFRLLEMGDATWFSLLPRNQAATTLSLN